ncbi:MAG: cytochrome b/b6 domain-containing protein [Rhodocyclaceae bacterium]|nr:cytochrome b/b6 domain-containing protein [Rhodocyclaceae bacterium]
MPVKVIVWDLPVRVFHWGLAVSVLTALITGLIGGDAMDLHMQVGYVIVVLVAFRLLWGFLGSTYARFDSFFFNIPATLDYCKKSWRGESPRLLGHTPLAGWMIALMLIALAVQTASGLYANDDIMAEGPLYTLVSKQTSDLLTYIHKLNFRLIIVLAVGHVTTIVGYHLIWKRNNLIWPMFTGRKTVARDRVPTNHHISPYRTNLSALALLILVAVAFYMIVAPQ